jgi:MSHA pilin protein MshA
MINGNDIRLAPSIVAGFTLIEIAATIVVLGILAAVAIPRFVNMSREARIAAVVMGAKTVASAASTVNLKVRVAGIPVDGTLRQVDVGGGDMIDVRYGYPACTLNGIAKAAGTNKGYVWYMGTDSGSCTLYPNAGKNSAGNPIYLNNCGAVYVNAQGTTWNPTTSGC